MLRFSWASSRQCVHLSWHFPGFRFSTRFGTDALSSSYSKVLTAFASYPLSQSHVAVTETGVVIGQGYIGIVYQNRSFVVGLDLL